MEDATYRAKFRNALLSDEPATAPTVLALQSIATELSRIRGLLELQLSQNASQNDLESMTAPRDRLRTPHVNASLSSSETGYPQVNAEDLDEHLEELNAELDSVFSAKTTPGDILKNGNHHSRSRMRQ